MSAETSPVVRLDAVQKWFGPTVALERIDLLIHSGDFLVLLGRNGAGKSTLLRIVARLIRPSAGTIEVCGHDLSREPEVVRGRVGFVGHNTYLYRNLTARENLRFFARMYRLTNGEGRIQQVLDWVGLRSSADREVKGFSRGMQQRLSLARANLHEPELLLLDEPFTGLDWEAGQLLTSWMGTLVNQGKTILMVTHDLEQGLEKVNRWLFLDAGKIVEELSAGCQTIREKYKSFLRERRSELA